MANAKDIIETAFENRTEPGLAETIGLREAVDADAVPRVGARQVRNGIQENPHYPSGSLCSAR